MNKIIARESSQLEFKESYNHVAMADYFKTIAAFANNKGGYLLFGVKDKPRVLIGLSEKSTKLFDEINVELFTGHLCDYFSPAIEWQHRLFEINEMKFGVIYIHELENKPCICKKTNEDNGKNYYIKEGEIYYRYRGRSERIHYSELHQILEEQRAKEARAWMTHLQKILHAGPANIATLDLNKMDITFNDGNGFILDKKLAEELLSKVKLIKEGSFSETDGKPTLKLIGNLVIPEAIPVPDLDVNTTYPYILKDLASALSLESIDVKALLWKYNLAGDKKYNYSVYASPKNTHPNQMYSKYAIEYIKTLLEQNTSADFIKTIRKEYFDNLKRQK